MRINYNKVRNEKRERNIQLSISWVCYQIVWCQMPIGLASLIQYLFKIEQTNSDLVA